MDNSAVPTVGNKIVGRSGLRDDLIRSESLSGLESTLTSARFHEAIQQGFVYLCRNKSYADVLLDELGQLPLSLCRGESILTLGQRPLSLCRGQ